MMEWITSLQLPPALMTFIIAMLPVAELRAAIPLALGVFGMSIPGAFIFSWLGSIVPAFLLVFGLGFISDFLSRHSKLMKKFFDWWFERTHKRFWKHHERFGSIALVLFVAIPLPVTGVWTGSVAAFLFGVEKKKAIGLIALGSFIAGIIVTLVYLGVFTFFNSI